MSDSESTYRLRLPGLSSAGPGPGQPQAQRIGDSEMIAAVLVSSKLCELLLEIVLTKCKHGVNLSTTSSWNRASDRHYVNQVLTISGSLRL